MFLNKKDKKHYLNIIRSGIDAGMDYDDIIELPVTLIWPLLVLIEKEQDEKLIKMYGNVLMKAIEKYEKDTLGYVYFIYCPTTDCVKIGTTKGDVKHRFKNIRGISSAGKHYELLGYIKGGLKTEKALHYKFRKFKKHCEWFDYKDIVKKHIKKLLEYEKM